MIYSTGEKTKNLLDYICEYSCLEMELNTVDCRYSYFTLFSVTDYRDIDVICVCLTTAI